MGRKASLHRQPGNGLLTASIDKIFEESGAVLHGHFLLASGRHSPVYWEKFRVIQDPCSTVKLCGMIAEHYKSKNVDVVAGPTTGGVVLAYEVARQLGVCCAFAEKIDGGRTFRRGVAIGSGQRVLIVDDILSTGTSVRDVIAAVKNEGGQIVGVAVLVDRSDQSFDLGVPLFACLRSATVSYGPDVCPLCLDGLPLTKLGGI